MMNIIKMSALRMAKIIFLMMLLSASIIGHDLNPGAQLHPQETIQNVIKISTGIVYYVDGINGNDSNPGTQLLPWRTIQKAANTLVAGEKAIVKGGIYNERVSETTSGSSGNEIIYQVSAGDTVTCKGFTISGSYVTVDGFKVDADDSNHITGKGFYVSSDHITVKNCYVTECPWGGIHYDENSSYGHIYNNRCYHNGQQGISVCGSYNLVENNEIWESVQHHPQGGPTQGPDANGITFFGDHHTFRGNWIHEPALRSDPYNIDPHIDCFQTYDAAAYGKPSGSYCTFERNHCRNYALGSTFMIEGSQANPAHHLTIKNNLFEVGWGINCKSGTYNHDIYIYNNTFIGDISITSNYPNPLVLGDASTVVIENNITINYKYLHRGLSLCTNLTVDYNCAYNTDGSDPKATIGPQSHELWAKDPKFVNLSNRNFHLQSSSPCIDAGASLSQVPDDQDGISRPQGAGWDIGAYEYAAGGTALSTSASASPTSGQAPLTVSFTGSATGGTSPYSYRWTFGDGGTSTTQNPSHTYPSAGTYTATLTVTDNVSATASKSLTITATVTPPALAANASASPTSGQTPLAVSFTGNATGGTSPYSYAWTFGDGGTSTTQNPSHTYSSAGSYTATLTVTDSVSATASNSLTITATSTALPLGATASASPTSGQAPLSVSFSGSATGGTSPYSYRWTFGDGGSSTTQNPAHTYSSAGSYTATFTVTDSLSATASRSLTIAVTAAPTQLVAIASASPTSGQAPLTVSFTGSATGGTSPYSYRWTFGDGASSTTQNPSHAYSSSGSYTATFTVTDGVSATASKSLTITVTAAPTQLVATASASPTSGQAPLTVSFAGSATGGTSPYSYRWTFGDGGTSTTQNPSHTYSSAGSYTATLTVTDSVSSTASKSLTITASDAPSQLVAVASADPTAGPAPLAVSFTASASGGTSPYSYSWTFGDGGTSTTQNPSHVYSTLGNYVATLTVTDTLSASADAMINISVASDTTAVLDLSAETGAPAPGEGGTTDPTPGNHPFSIGSAVEVDSIPKTDYRFSKWSGDVIEPSMFNLAATITLNTSKSVLATFCTKCADVNGDLKITPSDAQLAFDLYLGKIASPTWCELENADVNCSGTKLVPKITPSDAQMIFKKYLRKENYSFTCSGNSRAAAASQQNMLFSNVSLTVESSILTFAGDLLIPIIIESPSEIAAFGFDLAFPSDILTYIGLEGTELTDNFDQLEANVMSYQALGLDQSAAANPNDQVLRVGGYKTSESLNASTGVLVTLIFRLRAGLIDPDPVSIIATYDDIQNASIYAGSSIRLRENERRAENRRPADQRRRKAISRKFDF